MLLQKQYNLYVRHCANMRFEPAGITDDAELHVGQAHLGLEKREDGEDRLPVGVADPLARFAELPTPVRKLDALGHGADLWLKDDGASSR